MGKTYLGLVLILSLGMSAMGTSLFPEDSEEGGVQSRSKRSYPDLNGYIWSDYRKKGLKTVPYHVEMVLVHGEKGNSLYTFQKNKAEELIQEAVKDFHEHTCVRFFDIHRRHFPKSGPTLKIEVYDNLKYCSSKSTIGRNYEDNTIEFDIECDDAVGILRHRLYNVLGFHDEATRPESEDKFLNIRTHIKPYRTRQALEEDLPPFDMFSITNNWDEVNDDRFINRNTSARAAHVIDRLSYQDIKSINSWYGCHKKARENLGLGCSGTELPRVVGHGHLSSNDAAYEKLQAVQLICDPGYKPVHHDLSYCENGTFTPAIMECRKMWCEDLSIHCEELIEDGVDVCTNKTEICHRSCGHCDAACFIPPLVKGPGNIGTVKDVYYPGDTVELSCEFGYIANKEDMATCTWNNGTFDVNKFECIKAVTEKDERCRLDENDPECLNKDKTYTCEPIYLKYLNNLNGKIVPDKPYYQIGEVVQLKCDEGYEPSSVSTAQCRAIGTGQQAQFDHGNLNCLKKICHDSKEYRKRCKRIKAKGKCTHPKRIGFAREYCRRSCGLCGSCKGMPIFDRDISSLSSMKQEYEENESVKIECFHGSHADQTTSTCRNGQFDPPQLVCEPDLYSCELDYHVNERHVQFLPYQKKYYYNGEQHHFVCKVHSDPRESFSQINTKLPIQYTYTNSTCDEGTFDGLNCPMEYSCPFHLLRWSFDAICHGTNDSVTVTVEPEQDVYVFDDGFIKVFCDSTTMRFAKCDGRGQFYTDTVDYDHDYPVWKYRAHMRELTHLRIKAAEQDKIYPVDLEIIPYNLDNPEIADIVDRDVDAEAKQCRGLDLPTMHGRGSYSPLKAIYDHSEVVQVSCASESTVQALICFNGEFQPHLPIQGNSSTLWVACYEETCMDWKSDCREDGCTDPNVRFLCEQTCGVCEPPPCNVGSMDYEGELQIEDFNHGGNGWVQHGETDIMECSNAMENYKVHCSRGQLNNPLTKCTKKSIYDIWHCGNQFEFCDRLRDECYSSSAMTRFMNRCPDTCYPDVCRDWYQSHGIPVPETLGQ